MLHDFEILWRFVITSRNIFTYVITCFVNCELPGTRHLHCLDCFGASQKVKDCWTNAGYHSEAFDLKLHETHDLSTSGGCVELLRLLLASLGLVMFGNVCQCFGMFGFVWYVSCWIVMVLICIDRFIRS